MLAHVHGFSQLVCLPVQLRSSIALLKLAFAAMRAHHVAPTRIFDLHFDHGRLSEEAMGT